MTSQQASAAAGLATQPRSVLQFVLVGKNDTPLFDADLASMSPADYLRQAGDGGASPSGAGDGSASQGQNGAQRPQYLYHFILHAALDAVDDAEWTQKNAYLGTVDRFNNLNVTAYILPGNRMRLLLLHDGGKFSDELIKMFFRGVHQLLVPIVCNPFFLGSARITDVEFYEGVRTVAKAVFGV